MNTLIDTSDISTTSTPPTETFTGGVMFKNEMGSKGGFARLLGLPGGDSDGKVLLIRVSRKSLLSDGDFEVWAKLDLGDIAKAEGPVIFANGERKMLVESITLISPRIERVL